MFIEPAGVFTAEFAVYVKVGLSAKVAFVDAVYVPDSARPNCNATQLLALEVMLELIGVPAPPELFVACASGMVVVLVPLQEVQLHAFCPEELL